MPFKALIDRRPLLPVLSAVKDAVQRTTTPPILSNLAIEAGDGRLSFLGTDMELAIRMSVPAEIAGKGRITVGAEDLSRLVSVLPEGCQVEMEVEPKNERLVVRAGRTSAKLPTLPFDEFPRIDDVGSEATRFEIPATDLWRLLSIPAGAMSTEETRYYLNGVYLHPTMVEGVPEIRACATNGHILRRVAVPQPDGSAKMPGIIVPRHAVGIIVKRLPAAGTVELAASETRLQVTIGELTLTTKLIDGTYPDYERVIPYRHDRTATFSRADLLASVKRVQVLAEAEDKSKARAIRLSIGESGTAISSGRRSDGAEIEDEVEGTLEGSPVEVGFNSLYLAASLEAMATDEVDLLMTDAGAPSVLREAGDTAQAKLFVIMPMRV